MKVCGSIFHDTFVNVDWIPDFGALVAVGLILQQCSRPANALQLSSPCLRHSVMSRSSKPQDKGRYIHPKTTSSWEEEVKTFDYVYTKNFRVVPPYQFEFGSSIKERWVGQPLLQVFSEEFPYFDDNEAYYRMAMTNGLLRVNDEATSPDYLCRDGDVITHLVHRHEPPVSSEAVRLLHVTDELVVVNKPASMPIHPGGRYRRNSLVALLAKEHGLMGLHTLHRLDRLTSGLILLGRSAAVAEGIRKDFEAGRVRKQYLARVAGVFPEDEMRIDQPVRCRSQREAIHEIHPEGKASVTVVRRLATAGNESLVLCEPLTGRTHQIRLHLRWASFPIVNDPLYGPEPPPPSAASAAPAAADGQEQGEVAVGAKRSGDGGAEAEKRRRGQGWGCVWEEDARDDATLGLEGRGWLAEGCPLCLQARVEGCCGYFMPVKRKHDDSSSLGICLHALTNAGPTWSFATPLPRWALDMESPDRIAAAIPGYSPPPA